MYRTGLVLNVMNKHIYVCRLRSDVALSINNSHNRFSDTRNFSRNFRLLFYYSYYYYYFANYSINWECPHVFYANRRDYSIKRYANKRAFNARKSTFGFWFSTFYSNKRVMQLRGMRLSGLYCIAFKILTECIFRKCFNLLCYMLN